jgi:GntR family transcriptional regulator, transcriptional repressor for pyruvate dehydrogenase complex
VSQVKTSHQKETSKTLSSGLADRLCHRIQSDRLVPGTHLGTEADIADEYGVSRTVVREAVGCLRGLGVIEGKQGIGLSVAEGDLSSVLKKALVPKIVKPEGWQELSQLRAVIELGSLPLAVQNVTSEQIIKLNVISSEMRRLIKQKKKVTSKAEKELNELDFMFHQTIFEAAHGQLVKQFHDVLLEYFKQGENYGIPFNSEMLREHERITKAITNRDFYKAHEYLSKHLQPLIKSL